MNNMFTTIFNNERTPKWVKILIKIVLILFIIVIGVSFTYSSLTRKDYFGLFLSIIYNLIIIFILFMLVKNKKRNKNEK